MVIRRKLTSREEAARQNLKRLYEQRKRRDGITQNDVNQALGWTSSVMGQYITARLPLSPRTVAKLADYFKVYASDIDPMLAEEFKQTPESPLDLYDALERLTPEEIRKIVFDLSKVLPRKDMGALVKALVNRLVD